MYEKILIVNLGGIGDLLLSTPALRALKQKFNDARITMVVVPHVEELVRALPYIDEVIGFSTDYRYFFNDVVTLLSLRKRHFDLAINMRTLTSDNSAKKMKLIFDIIHPKTKAGRDTSGRGSFFDIKIPEEDIGEKYEMEYDIEMARALGAEVADKDIDFRIEAGHNERMKKLLEANGIFEQELIIGIHPGGKSSHRWPLDNFVKVMGQLQKNISCRFVITGSKDEIGLADKLILLSGQKALNLAGKLQLKELGALINRCGLFITNDTGPMHIAAVLKVPLVAIFGPGYISRYDPRCISDQTEVFYVKAPCAPCDKPYCGNLECFKAVAPEAVAAAALKLLGR